MNKLVWLDPNPSWFHLTTTSFDSPHHRWPSSITEIRYYLLISKISWMAEEIWIDRVVLELKEKMKFVDETPSHLRDDYFQAGLMADYSRSWTGTSSTRSVIPTHLTLSLHSSSSSWTIPVFLSFDRVRESLLSFLRSPPDHRSSRPSTPTLLLLLLRLRLRLLILTHPAISSTISRFIYLGLDPIQIESNSSIIHSISIGNYWCSLPLLVFNRRLH